MNSPLRIIPSFPSVKNLRCLTESMDDFFQQQVDFSEVRKRSTFRFRSSEKVRGVSVGELDGAFFDLQLVLLLDGFDAAVQRFEIGLALIHSLLQAMKCF